VDVNYFIYTIIIQAFFVDCFRYIVAHYFARPLMYPGSVKLLQNAMSKPCFFLISPHCWKWKILKSLPTSVFLGQALNDGRSSLIAKVIFKCFSLSVPNSSSQSFNFKVSSSVRVFTIVLVSFRVVGEQS
jgi:hypothetical protein